MFFYNFFWIFLNFFEFFWIFLNFFDFFLNFLIFWFFWFFWFLCHYHTTRQFLRSLAENACNFTLSCSWRRRFNKNNNSKQCCFKNQRWQNNPFSSKSKQKSGHLVPVSERWVWQCLSWETFLPTVPCQRTPLSLARVKRGPGHFFFFFFFLILIFFFFFAAEYSGTRNCTRVLVNRAGTRAFDYPSQL